MEYDQHGPVRISGPDDVVWERPAEPWPDLLRRGAAALAEQCVEAIAGADADPATEAYCVMLTYVGDGGLHTMVTVGTQSERREALAEDADDPHEVACHLWYPEPEELSFLEVEDIEDMDLLFREAAINDPREAQRTVLTETAKLLARRDWSGILMPTADFVVYIAEHDEGFAEKHRSVREVNPPDRVAIWDANWPAGVPRDDDE